MPRHRHKAVSRGVTCPQIERARSSHPRIASQQAIVPRQRARGRTTHKRLPSMNDQRTNRLTRGVSTAWQVIVTPCAAAAAHWFVGWLSGGGSCGHVRFAGTSPPANLLLPLPRHRVWVRHSRSRRRETAQGQNSKGRTASCRRTTLEIGRYAPDTEGVVDGSRGCEPSIDPTCSQNSAPPESDASRSTTLKGWQIEDLW